MAKKRGGLAGIWDRNKNIIKPLATGVAGALTGGVGAAALGGLMSGLDREGKRGIGLDLGKAAKGAVTGYGTGMAGAGLKGLLTGGTAGAQAALGQYNEPLSRMAGKLMPGGGSPAGMEVGVTPGTGGITREVSAPITRNATRGVQSLLGFARENKDLIGGAAKGLQMALPDRDNEAAMMNAETARQRLAMEQDEMDEARRVREARAEMTRRLLAPYIEQYSPALRGYLNG